VNAQADTVIVHTYGGGAFEEMKQIIACSSGGYLMCGTTGSADGLSTDMYLVRTDDSLNCLWNLVIEEPGSEWGTGVVEYEDDVFYICGFSNSEDVGGYDVLVANIDLEGNLVWKQPFGGEDWDFSNQIIRHPNGGLVVAGRTYSFGSGSSDGFLLHVSANGDLVNQWVYGGANDDAFTDLIWSPQGLLVCGYITTGELRKAVVWKMNSNWGEIDWMHVVTDDVHAYEATAISVDNEYIYLTGNRDSDQFTFGFAERLSYLGNSEMWSSTPLDNSYYYYDIAPSPSGFFAVGSQGAFGEGGFYAMLFEFTDFGGYEGGFYYGQGADDRFQSVIVQNGDLVFCGALQTEPNQWQGMAMLHAREVYDNNNIMDPDHQECLTVGIPESVNDPLKVEGEYAVFLGTGQLIAVGYTENVFNLDLSLSPGFYIIHLKDVGYVRKVIVY